MEPPVPISPQTQTVHRLTAANSHQHSTVWSEREKGPQNQEKGIDFTAQGSQRAGTALMKAVASQTMPERRWDQIGFY